MYFWIMHTVVYYIFGLLRWVLFIFMKQININNESINKNKWIRIFMKLIYFKNIDNPSLNATKVTIVSFSSILINLKNNHILFNQTYPIIYQKIFPLQFLTWQNTAFHKLTKILQIRPTVSLFEAIMLNLTSSK